MKPSCSPERHTAIKAASRRAWLANTVGLPHFGGRRVVDEDGFGGLMEYANCAHCDQTMVRSVRPLRPRRRKRPWGRKRRGY